MTHHLLGKTRHDVYYKGVPRWSLAHFGPYETGEDEIIATEQYDVLILQEPLLLRSVKITTNKAAPACKVLFSVWSGSFVSIDKVYVDADIATAQTDFPLVPGTMFDAVIKLDKFTLIDAFSKVTGWTRNNWNDCRLSFQVTGTVPAGLTVSIEIDYCGRT